jgi:hypothetical protein
MARNFRIWISRIFGVVLTVIGLGGIPDDVATWSDWIKTVQLYLSQDVARWTFVMAGVAIMTGPTLLNHLRRRKEFSPKDVRDMTICDAIVYIANDSRWGLKINDHDESIEEAARVLRLAALNGELDVWGRLEYSAEYVLIDRLYWDSAVFDLIECTDPDGTGGKSQKRAPWGSPDITVYVGLRAERRRIEELWPSPLFKKLTSGMKDSRNQ